MPDSRLLRERVSMKEWRKVAPEYRRLLSLKLGFRGGIWGNSGNNHRRRSRDVEVVIGCFGTVLAVDCLEHCRTKEAAAAVAGEVCFLRFPGVLLGAGTVV